MKEQTRIEGSLGISYEEEFKLEGQVRPKDKRLWFCPKCNFYHHLSEPCPKTGLTYDDVFLVNSKSTKRSEK